MSDLINEDQLAVVMFCYTKLFSPSLQVFAIFANVVNCVVFSKIGLGDSMNVTLLALSLSEMAYAALDATITVITIIALSPWQRDLPIGMYSLSGCINWYQFVFLDVSVCLETYLAITRCCCVSLPLNFKNIFTVRRTLVIIALVLVCCAGFRIPLFSSYGLSWKTNRLTNLTKLSFSTGSNFQMFNLIEQVAGRTIFPVISLFVSTVCTVILTATLVRASERRKLMTSHSACNHDNQDSAGARMSPGHNRLKSLRILKTKEVQMVKAVALVIFLLGIMLLVISVFSLTQAYVPELFPGKRYNNLHAFLTTIVNLLVIAHAGYKIFIYYRFNRRFRSFIRVWLLWC